LRWQLDSDDEREAAAAKVGLVHKMAAQSKKKIKNKARLPRTAGLRTLTDLTTDLTKAGIDPSRVQERAVVIAKVRAAERKRKRDEDENGMDVDDADVDDFASGGEEEDGSMMDMDGDGEEQEGTPQKRSRANSGAVIARKRAPRSNRQLAGLRDEAVCRRQTNFTPQQFFLSPFLQLDWRQTLIGPFCFVLFTQQASKAVRLRNLGQRGRNMLAKAGESDRAIRVKMVRPRYFFISFTVLSCVSSCVVFWRRRRARLLAPPPPPSALAFPVSTYKFSLTPDLIFQPKHLFSGKRKAGKTNRR